jgi:hypothetical protein
MFCVNVKEFPHDATTCWQYKNPNSSVINVLRMAIAIKLKTVKCLLCETPRKRRNNFNNNLKRVVFNYFWLYCKLIW